MSTDVHVLCPSLPDTPPLTVLVTGANGLVGRALCAELAGRGVRVLAAVRNLASFQSPSGVQPVQAPDLDDVSAQWSLTGVDVVVHTAARVHVMNPAPDENERFLRANRDGTAQLASQCAAQGVKRLVFLSTIKVNGESTAPGVPFTAVDSPSPVDPYAVSKHEAEMRLLAVSQQTGLEVTIIRPPLVYGAGAKGNLGLLERAVRKGLPLPIGGLDANRRSLVSLTNLVDLIARCVYHPGAANRVFLASDDEDVSTLSLAQVIARACGVRLRTLAVPVSLLEMGASLSGRRDMLRRLTDSLQVDISATCAQLDWQPVQSVEQAMTEAFAKGTRRAHALSR